MFNSNNRNNANRRPAPGRGVTSGRTSSAAPVRSSSSGSSINRSSDDGFTGFGGFGDSDRCTDNSSGSGDSDSGSCSGE
jgi:hypothetical protein